MELGEMKAAYKEWQQLCSRGEYSYRSRSSRTKLSLQALHTAEELGFPWREPFLHPLVPGKEILTPALTFAGQLERDRGGIEAVAEIYFCSHPDVDRSSIAFSRKGPFDPGECRALL